MIECILKREIKKSTSESERLFCFVRCRFYLKRKSKREVNYSANALR